MNCLMTSTLLALAFSHASMAGEADAFQEPVAPVSSPSDDWEFKFSMYGPIVGLDGTTRVGAAILPVDIGFDDIWDNMDAGIVLAGEARKGKWSLTGDLIWLKLSVASTPTPTTYIGTTIEQTVGSLALGYEIYEDERWTVDFLAGGAYTGLDVSGDVTAAPTPPASRTGFISGSQDWVDPFVGVRFRYRAGDHWRLFGRFDYGGWGVASDTYLQAMLGVGYQFTDTVGLFAAYRYLTVDYSDGPFAYDVDTKGPQVGLVFSF
ncbi:porin family protein [Haloferula rosea]|uniref:Outer membrane protein beta-barrel domain-containing protein n=1 Tax=Haloferula rosea TaxID=490093 RepID=A0A934VH76_9BACT|nr:porin family protein [Haloferula rosea]MBK1828782.1 hypothetical protein [Haloferula rosea]